MAYAWSQRGISYVLSTCGSTKPAEKMYMSYFEDDYGNVGSKEINRPELAHLLYDYLPLIDEHNKQRQKNLGLERKWPTRNCWFRLLTTLLGMSIVDMHRLYRNLRNEAFIEVDILEFSDMICKKLTVRSRRQTERLASLRGETADDASILERITDKDGNNRFSVTDKQLSRGRNVGRSIHQNCYICRKYLTPEGDTEYNQTTFRCMDCKMPLCKKDRSNPAIGRNQSCMVEHIKSRCEVVGCFGSDRSYSIFPRENQVQLVSYRLTRNMRGQRSRV